MTLLILLEQFIHDDSFVYACATTVLVIAMILIFGLTHKGFKTLKRTFKDPVLDVEHRQTVLFFCVIFISFAILAVFRWLFIFYKDCITTFWLLFLEHLFVCFDFPVVLTVLILHNRNFDSKIKYEILPTESDTDMESVNFDTQGDDEIFRK